jgi:hypothetical protein
MILWRPLWRLSPSGTEYSDATEWRSDLNSLHCNGAESLQWPHTTQAHVIKTLSSPLRSCRHGTWFDLGPHSCSRVGHLVGQSRGCWSARDFLIVVVRLDSKLPTQSADCTRRLCQQVIECCWFETRVRNSFLIETCCWIV